MDSSSAVVAADVFSKEGTGINLLIAAIVMVAGLAGAWFHFLEEKKTGRVTGSFFNYMVLDSPGQSGSTLAAFVTAMGALYWAGTFEQVRMDAFVEALKAGVLYSPMVSAIVVSFTTGYACDSKLNHGSPPVVSAMAPVSAHIIAPEPEKQFYPRLK
jgi:hypothetical protein